MELCVGSDAPKNDEVPSASDPHSPHGGLQSSSDAGNASGPDGNDYEDNGSDGKESDVKYSGGESSIGKAYDGDHSSGHGGDGSSASWMFHSSNDSDSPLEQAVAPKMKEQRSSCRWSPPHDHDTYPLNWFGSVERGRALLAMMKAGSLAEASRIYGNDASSKFPDLTGDVMKDFGWATERGDGKLNQFITMYYNMYDVLETTDDPFGVDIMVDHLYPWFDEENNFHKQGTKASYKNTYLVDSGIIIAWSNFSPGHMIARNQDIEWDPEDPPDFETAEIPPPLHHWSDFAHLFWREQCIENLVDPATLRYVACDWIINEATHHIVKYAILCLTQELELPRWETGPFVISMEEDEGLALLGSPKGRGIGWMLLQHKDTFGVKAVTHALCFRTALSKDFFPGEWYESIEIIFVIDDVPAEAAGENKIPHG
ncbi:hypothetical protein EJ06DRAFT_545634 [Trichodelitschia bisporula]|uniref:Uncharacterized protein n=1 Tax=Trichodelitschia bisporula TaxID=703511 RepID=A0A6G1IAL2_9PEZI|nr:hypothetical protein EJ06DRAFT_545634 [Trichodelitschia bisporula]